MTHPPALQKPFYFQHCWPQFHCCGSSPTKQSASYTGTADAQHTHCGNQSHWWVQYHRAFSSAPVYHCPCSLRTLNGAAKHKLPAGACSEGRLQAPPLSDTDKIKYQQTVNQHLPGSVCAPWFPSFPGRQISHSSFTFARHSRGGTRPTEAMYVGQGPPTIRIPDQKECQDQLCSQNFLLIKEILLKIQHITLTRCRSDAVDLPGCFQRLNMPPLFIIRPWSYPQSLTQFSSLPLLHLVLMYFSAFSVVPVVETGRLYKQWTRRFW